MNRAASNPHNPAYVQKICMDAHAKIERLRAVIENAAAELDNHANRPVLAITLRREISPNCDHEWVEGHNEVASGFEVCVKCKETRPTPSHERTPEE